MKRLAIITTHPIQYNAPWFRLISQRHNVLIKVFYTWSQAKDAVKDYKFRKEISWDIPLLEGYDYEFVENQSKHPGSHHFFGIDCPTLIPRIEHFAPDAILFFGWNFKSYVLALRHFKGKIPVWFRGDSTLLNETRGYKTRLRRIFLKKIYNKVDKAFYVGQANKAYFLEHGLAEHQLIYAPHAIDNDRFKDDDAKYHEVFASNWRKELGFSSNDIVILFAGKFEKKKQPDFLIEAIIEANKMRSDPLKLVLVGDGPLANELKVYNEANDFITILPFQNQTTMPNVYRLGNVFCLPSKGPAETWGLAVNEAMACSRPVIVSDKVGCATDLVNQNQNGYQFSYANQDELVRILNNLSLSELQNFGKRAFNDIQKYNFEAIVKAVENEIFKLKCKKSV